MQLILEEDQTVNVKTMSVVKSSLTENIPNVSPSVNNITLPIPIKESTDILAENKNGDSTEDSEKRNSIPETQSEEGSVILEEKGKNTVESNRTTYMSEKEDIENNYDDKEKTNEQIDAAETVNGSDIAVDGEEQSIKETENDNISNWEKVETKNNETVLSNIIPEPTIKDVETDLDFSDENATDESFEIKLDSTFEDLEDDTSKTTENTVNIEKIDVEFNKMENTNDQMGNLAEFNTHITDKSKDSVEGTEDLVDNTEDIVQKTKDTVEKTKHNADKTDDVAEKPKNVIEKTEDIVEKAENIVEKIEDRVDESKGKPDITTVNKSETDNEVENSNSTENVNTGRGDAHISKLTESIELSKPEETEFKSCESKTVKESATESMDTEKTADKEALISDSSVIVVIQENKIEPNNTGKEASDEDLVDFLDNETIKKSAMEINESDKESLREAQPIEKYQAGVEDSLVVSVGASELEANCPDNIPMEIDTTSALTKETKENNEKQKEAETSLKVPKERSSSSDVEIMDVDNDDTSPKNKEEVSKPAAETDAPVKNKKRDSRINLDIFSDEEDDEPESKKKEPTTEKPVKIDAQPNLDTQIKVDPSKECVSLDDDDDDDIMVIDDVAGSKNNKETAEGRVADKTEESEKAPEIPDKSGSDNDDSFVSADSVHKEKAETPVESESEMKKTADRPLAASDFINNFKTKISEMTRAELEEFCLLKIVEGVVDRSNLSEIKDKLKQMVLNVEEWRKKTLVLNKQNRDLQIVLRTVQEEQKRRSDEMITPLKITRSVGMQVLIGDGKADPLSRLRPNQKRPAPVQAPPQKPPNPPPSKPEPKTSKPSPIPVPRLVPAQSPTKPGPSKPSPLQNATVTSNTKNGMKTTAKGAEKRPLGDTVDLTDDEPAPPSKRPPPVRLVPSNQLLAPRGPLVSKTGSPRQVYIPIGQQANIRPGQKIAFKSPSTGPSPRGHLPGVSVMRNAAPRTVAPRGPNKHPAPLPQAYQQPQPPNWKALPPAPDLKISKIENGIVVSWKIDGYQEDSYEEIVSYQLYAYQETSQPASTFLWNKIGDIKALPLPMACTLTQFIAGYKYYFAVRAVDVRSRLGPFSLPGSILLLNK